MRLNAIAAILSWSVGAACLSAAASSPLRAVDCQPQLWSPARCVPAHADPPTQTGGGAYCQIDAGNACVRASGSLCVDRYATAVPGDCEPYADYSNPTSCTENYGVTIVEVHRYVAECKFESSSCRCVFTRDTAANPVQIEVCQCSETSL